MKYNPIRDIPKASRELHTTSPTDIAKWVKAHRTVEDKRTGKRKQAEVTSQSINMYFWRHPEVRQELEAEFTKEELTQTAHSELLFENGTFREIPCIKTWTLELIGRSAKQESINSFVGAIKRVCMGLIRKKGIRVPRKREHYDVIQNWGLKHPASLTVKDGLIYIAEMTQRKYNTRDYRLALRNFFESRGVKGHHKISGATEGAGKYAHLYITKEEVYTIFEYLKKLNYEAYLCAKFSFKCGGTRISATLNAEASKIVVTEHEVTIWVLEKATKGKEKRNQEKLIPEDFWQELKPRYERGGKLFNIEAQELNNLLNTAYKDCIPHLAGELGKPFHFWRHQFAQHMLRATGWNYGLVATLGHWTVGTLERYYGKMGRDIAFKTAEQPLLSL